MKAAHAISMAIIWIASAVGAVLLKEPNIFWAPAVATLAWLDRPWDKQKED